MEIFKNLNYAEKTALLGMLSKLQLPLDLTFEDGDFEKYFFKQGVF